MQFIPVKTKAILPPKENIYGVLDEFLPALKERDVLLITSKILAIHQGRCVKITPEIDRKDLIKKEAERYVVSHSPSGDWTLTIKNYTLIPSAGIDESNGNGYYILWPKNIPKLAKEICQYLKKKFLLKNLAVIVTDSHTIPLRYGVIGISIGFYGLEPLYNYEGKPDIFGRKLKYTKTNIADALAAMGVLLMGEGKERTPILIIRNAKFVRFTEKNTYKKLVIPPEEDIYKPLLEVMKEK